MEELRGLLERERRGHWEDIYDASSEAFRESIDRGIFEKLLTKRTQRLGRFVRIADLSTTWRSPRGNQAEVVAALQYERATVTATVEFIYEDGGWKLLGYKIVLPQPSVPNSSTPRAE